MPVDTNYVRLKTEKTVGFQSVALPNSGDRTHVVFAHAPHCGFDGNRPCAV